MVQHDLRVERYVHISGWNTIHSDVDKLRVDWQPEPVTRFGANQHDPISQFLYKSSDIVMALSSFVVSYVNPLQTHREYESLENPIPISIGTIFAPFPCFHELMTLQATTNH